MKRCSLCSSFVLPLGILAACSSGSSGDFEQGAGLYFPNAVPPLVIDSLDGEVTQHEVDSFLAAVSATTIPTLQYAAGTQYPNGGHNLLADGTGGTTLEGINRMYEVTGAIASLNAEHSQLLDLAIKWSDAWLSHRNDLPLGEHRVMWTGNIDPVWPPDAPPDQYAGCEVGETVGILAYTALNIVKTPSLWSNTVPDGDPNGYGATYLARAKTYVSMLEYSMDNYFNKYFLDQTTLTILRPSAAAYNATPSNAVNAWNREMMFLHAWQTLSEVHQLLGDDPSRAAMYKQITENTVNLFVQNALAKSAPDGTPVYDWGYGNFGDIKNSLTGEQIGVHAQYDIWGLTRAYRAGYTKATPQQMKTYADTVAHELMISPGVYASHIDRCCDTVTYSYLPSGFIYLTPYNTDIYKAAANADIQSGRQKSDAGMTAGILWAKHWIAAAAARGAGDDGGTLAVDAADNPGVDAAVGNGGGAGNGGGGSSSGAHSGASGCSTVAGAASPNPGLILLIGLLGFAMRKRFTRG
jgi:hypothetical protein